MKVRADVDVDVDNAAPHGRQYRAEIGASHAELLARLPSAVAPYVVRKLNAECYALSCENRVATLHLSPSRTRAIASMRLPVTEISIAFENFSEVEYSRFMKRFKTYLHRGGG